MVELEEVKTLVFFEGRQQQSDVHCPGILLGRDCHGSSAYFHCRHSVASPLQLASTTCGGPGVLGLLAFYHQDTRVVQKAKELVPRMFVVHYNST